jgi:beta-glucosidase
MPHDSHQAPPRYLDAHLPTEERVRDLLTRMTLEEKIAQLGSRWVYELFEDMRFSASKASALLSKGIGQITRIGGASNLDATASADLANTIQRYLIENTRLGIPAIVHEECCAGYMALGATCFPQAIGIASTWDPDLVEKMGSAIRAEMRAVGAHQGLSPVLDVNRDPRWGRVEETFGEDPYLVSRIGAAYVRGLQGPNLKEGVLATGKHFVGYGNSEGGMNWAPAHIPPRELLEVFVTPFEAVIKTAGLATIMNAYHELDGIPCGSSEELFGDLLRKRLGFTGLVVSDYFAVDQLHSYHHVARDKQEAALMALSAGIDVELPSTDCYGEPLLQLVEDGRVKDELINTVVSRILQAKFSLGLFEEPYVDVGKAITVLDQTEHRTLARTLAQESIILLKNEGNLLPLKKDLPSLAVIGPNADMVRHMVGDYAYPAHIETLVEMAAHNPFGMPAPEKIELVEDFVPMMSVLQSIRRAVPPQTQVRYAKGCDVLGESREGFVEAVELARQSEVAVLVVGGKSGLTDDCTCGEARDRANLGLPGVQEALVQAVYETGTPVVMVIIDGRPLAIPWIADHIPAVLHAWLPGEEGAVAIADVLFGDINPGGKLPISVPRDVGQVPVYYGHKLSGGRSHWKGDYVTLSTKPLYPFGHGLSYSQFHMDKLVILPTSVTAGQTVDVRVDVTNAGNREGDEVVQLYTRMPMCTVTRPVKELKGFKRIRLVPGQTKTVTFHLAVNQLGFYNRAMAFVVEAGPVEVMIGSSSEDIQATGSFEIVGDSVDISAARVYFGTVDVDWAGKVP